MTLKGNSDEDWSKHSAPSTKHNWTDSDKNSLDNDIEQFSRTTGGGCMLNIMGMMVIVLGISIVSIVLISSV